MKHLFYRSLERFTLIPRSTEQLTMTGHHE